MSRVDGRRGQSWALLGSADCFPLATLSLLGSQEVLETSDKGRLGVPHTCYRVTGPGPSTPRYGLEKAAEGKLSEGLGPSLMFWSKSLLLCEQKGEVTCTDISHQKP